MYIDSHQHFWKISRGDYSWMTAEHKELYRDFGTEDLLPLLNSKNISKTIIVQAADSIKETEFILDIASTCSFVAGVVGWANFESPSIKAQIDSLSVNRFLKGFRPMIHDIDDENWMLLPNLKSGFDYLIEKNLSFDALVRPNHLKNLYVFANKYSELKIVIDHIAKPLIATQDIGQWKADMKKLSQLENIYCKYSGILTEAGPNYNVERIKPYTDFIFETFDSCRLMWGSDWPVLTMAEQYPNWFDLAHELASGLSRSELNNLFRNTAEKFYQL